MSSLTFSKKEDSRSSLPHHLPRVHANQKFVPYFILFLLRKELGSSLKSSLNPTALRFQLQSCGCYQPQGLSSFNFRLSVPLLSVSRFYFGAEGTLVEF
nr:hypothetical protein CFP56_62312 [Quercus suber]